jgi:hypothetical protein
MVLEIMLAFVIQVAERTARADELLRRLEALARSVVAVLQQIAQVAQEVISQLPT